MTHHDTLYAKFTATTAASVTIGPDDRGTIRIVKDDAIHERPLLFPAILRFENYDTVQIQDRAKLDRIMEQQGYARFSL